jgi:hypothetical protein
LWNRTFGGIEVDSGFSVQQTTDGGYIIVGITESFGAGDWDVWLIKTDNNGNVMWNSTFGGLHTDEGYFVQQTSNEGYIILGGTASFGAGDWDVWFIETDANGDKVWDRTFGGLYHDFGFSAQQTSNGDYIIAGTFEIFDINNMSFNTEVWLIKTNSTGYELWNRTFGGTSDDMGWSVQQTTDLGYIITGYTGSFGAGRKDVWLIKTDSQGRAKNMPPKKPIITGRTNGKMNTEYEYKFISIDPEGDNIEEYFIDWGDNSGELSIGPYQSGVEASANHTWSEKGDYTIKVKARDILGAESNWSTLTVNMPKTKIYNPMIQLIMKLLDCFPFIEKIINQIKSIN